MVSENICLNLSLSSEREKRTKKQTNKANKQKKKNSHTQEWKFCVTPRVSFDKTYDVSTELRTPDL